MPLFPLNAIESGFVIVNAIICSFFVFQCISSLSLKSEMQLDVERVRNRLISFSFSTCTYCVTLQGEKVKATMRIVEYPSVRVNCGQLMVHLNVAHANTIQKKPLYHFTILTAFSTKLSSPIIKSLFWLLKCSNISTIVFRTNKNRNSTYLQRKKKETPKKQKLY